MLINTTPKYDTFTLNLTTHKGKSGCSSINHIYFALKEYRDQMLELVRRNPEEAQLPDSPDNTYLTCLNTMAEIDELLDDVSTAMMYALEGR